MSRSNVRRVKRVKELENYHLKVQNQDVIQSVISEELETSPYSAKPRSNSARNKTIPFLKRLHLLFMTVKLILCAFVNLVCF